MMGALLLLMDTILIPVHHQNGHWSVVAIFINARTLVHLNSIRDVKSSMHVFRVILVVIEYIMHACGKSIRFQDWVFISPRHLTLQRDDTSCGVFTCVNGYNLISENTVDVNNTFINEYRYWIAFKIINRVRDEASFRKQVVKSALHEETIKTIRNEPATRINIKSYKITIVINVPGYSKSNDF